MFHKSQAISKRIVYLILPFLIVSCNYLTSEEIGRLSFKSSSSVKTDKFKELQIDLKKGDVIYFWSNMDVEYRDDVDLRFKVEIHKNSSKYTVLEIDPTDKNITIGEAKSTFGNRTTWSFTGKNEEVEIHEDARYTFKASLLTSANSSLIINKADLVLRM